MARGELAADFNLTGADGKSVRPGDFAGQAVLVVFRNATGPRDALLKIHDRYLDQRLALLVIFSGTPRASFDIWVARNTPADGMTAAWDPAGRGSPESVTSARFGLGVVPAPGVIGREGKVVGGFVRFGSQSPAFAVQLLVAAGLTPAAVDAPSLPPPAAPRSGVTTTLGVGAMAPDFTTLDAEGRPVKLSDYAGKIVVLDFWATWCGPCIASLPHTEKVAAATKAPGVAVLASGTNEPRAVFDPWLKKTPRFIPR